MTLATSVGSLVFGFYSLFLYSMVTQYKCTLLCSTDIVQYVQCTFAFSVCINNILTEPFKEAENFRMAVIECVIEAMLRE